MFTHRLLLHWLVMKKTVDRETQTDFGHAAVSLLVQHCRKRTNHNKLVPRGYIYLKWKHKKGTTFYCVVPTNRIDVTENLPSRGDKNYARKMYMIRNHGFQVALKNNKTGWLAPTTFKRLPWVFLIPQGPPDKVNVLVDIAFSHWEQAYLAAIQLHTDVEDGDQLFRCTYSGYTSDHDDGVS